MRPSAYAVAARPTEISLEIRLALHREMLRIRLFEGTPSALYKEGEIPGFVHLSIGQEAIAVGGRHAERRWAAPAEPRYKDSQEDAALASRSPFR